MFVVYLGWDVGQEVPGCSEQKGLQLSVNACVSVTGFGKHSCF